MCLFVCLFVLVWNNTHEVGKEGNQFCGGRSQSRDVMDEKELFDIVIMLDRKLINGTQPRGGDRAV